MKWATELGRGPWANSSGNPDSDVRTTVRKGRGGGARVEVVNDDLLQVGRMVFLPGRVA